MESPDVELELTRNEEGSIIHLAYKVHTRADEGRSALEFCELAATMLEAEGHELIGVHDVRVLDGVTS